MPDTQKFKALPMKACRHCGGTGKEVDPLALGVLYRATREEIGMSLREMARRLHISAPYLSDLEQGHRAWSPDLMGRFATQLDQWIAQQKKP